MSAASQVEILMKEIGPLLDPLCIDAFPEQQCWGLQLDEDTSLLVDLDETARKLVVSHEVGTPPEGDRFRLYELMLIHNHQWDKTGGRRMAVDVPGGSVVLLQDLALEDLDVARLCDAIESFAAAARSWRQIIATLRPGGAPPSEGPWGSAPPHALNV